MVPRKQGHIINLGSIAGKEVYEKGNMYCATKSAVDAISEAMRIDLLRHSYQSYGHQSRSGRNRIFPGPL